MEHKIDERPSFFFLNLTILAIKISARGFTHFMFVVINVIFNCGFFWPF